MNSNFYAYLSRMKLIQRWSLMRSIQPENIQEHSHQVAVLAHALCLIDNCYFGGNCNAEHAAALALFHDVGEVIIGDLPTPVKYFNPQIKQVYGEIEQIAQQKLLHMLPEQLRGEYDQLFDEEMTIEARYVKAADKISAYIKCAEEVSAGNNEFSQAEKSVRAELDKYFDLPAVPWFIEHCLDAFSRTLDELG